MCSVDNSSKHIYKGEAEVHGKERQTYITSTIGKDLSAYCIPKQNQEQRWVFLPLVEEEKSSVFKHLLCLHFHSVLYTEKVEQKIALPKATH